VVENGTIVVSGSGTNILKGGSNMIRATGTYGQNLISVDSVDIAMLHIAEDFRMKFVPTPQDYLKHVVVQPWFNNAVKNIDNPEAEQTAKEFLEKISQ